VRPKKASFGSSFLDALKRQYITHPHNRAEEAFTFVDSRNVSVAVEVVGNAKVEERLRFHSCINCCPHA
jgi:hypothetical protein